MILNDVGKYFRMINIWNGTEWYTCDKLNDAKNVEWVVYIILNDSQNAGWKVVGILNEICWMSFKIVNDKYYIKYWMVNSVWNTEW